MHGGLFLNIFNDSIRNDVNYFLIFIKVQKINGINFLIKYSSSNLKISNFFKQILSTTWWCLSVIIIFHLCVNVSKKKLQLHVKRADRERFRV